MKAVIRSTGIIRPDIDQPTAMRAERYSRPWPVLG